MGLKEILNSHPEINTVRYNVSRNTFVLCALVFFLNYYFVGAGFFPEIFEQSITFTYTVFVFFLILYIYFLIKTKLFVNKSSLVYYFIIFLLFLLFIAALMPFLIDKNILIGLKK